MKRSRSLFITCLCFCVFWLGATRTLQAQTFSYDGNRWYEIEVSIFSNETTLPGNELLIPDKTDLSFPESIRTLVPASEMFAVAFDQPNDAFLIQEQTFNPAFNSPFNPPSNINERAFETGKQIGPDLAHPDASFRLTDFERDPFIALGSAEAEFTAYNRDIIESADHRLLFHKVWRQPILNRVQATAILVTGGENLGGRHELEGSLTFSFNVNRVDVDARLWLIDFSAANEPGSVQWQLPAYPEQIMPENISQSSNPLSNPSSNPPSNPPSNPTTPVRYLSFMKQVRSMVSNELHFLDHPDFGILVQIRPYQLPERDSFLFE